MQPIQPKSLSWWGEVGNSLIFQHSPSRGGSLRPRTWNRSEQQLFYLIALTRIELETSGFDTILSCMHQPIQPKSLSWWGEVGNSLIFQHIASANSSTLPMNIYNDLWGSNLSKITVQDPLYHFRMYCTHSFFTQICRRAAYHCIIGRKIKIKI